MNKKANLKKLILVFAFILCLIITGCQGTSFTIRNTPEPKSPPPAKKETGPPPWAPAHGYRAKYKYRYYPNSRVYYEEGSKVYFYYKDGNWQVSASLPGEIRIDVSDFVTLEMNTSRPYEYDDEVVNKYPPGQQKKKKKKKKKKDKWK